MNGQIIQQTVVQEIVTDELTAKLPVPTSGVSYSVKTVEVSSTTIDISAAYTQTFTTAVIQSDTTAIVDIISAQYSKFLTIY